MAELSTFSKHVNHLLKKITYQVLWQTKLCSHAKTFNIVTLTKTVIPSQEELNEQLEQDDYKNILQFDSNIGKEARTQRRDLSNIEHREKTTSAINARDLGIIVMPLKQNLKGSIT